MYIYFCHCGVNRVLIHWGWVTHICVGKLTTIGSDNGLPPGRCQAIIWTNAGILFTGPLGTNPSEILIKIQIFSLKKIHLKMSSVKFCPSCIGLNVLIHLELIQKQAFNFHYLLALHTKTGDVPGCIFYTRINLEKTWSTIAVKRWAHQGQRKQQEVDFSGN